MNSFPGILTAGLGVQRESLESIVRSPNNRLKEDLLKPVSEDLCEYPEI